DIGDAFSARRLKLRECRPRGNLQHETAVSLPMRGLVLLVAALSLVACTATPAASPSAPSPTVRVDAGGNAFPPLGDENAWSDLCSNSRKVTELRFELDTRVRAGKSNEGWRYLPSTVNVEGPGCYGLQIDGPGWTTTIVMRALA